MLRSLLKRGFPKKTRSSGRIVPRWAIGVAVATPLAATLQGCLMLQQYRREHGHAPHPISPSQGLVVASSKRYNSSNNNNNSSSYDVASSSARQRPPLRLLVLGDSLAAGVGISQSGTPILPQSIASALSGASNGRAVHWTCIGTPGASSSQIVHDLGAYQDSPSLLERKHVEWQVATRKAKEWWEHRQSTEMKQEQRREEAAGKNRVQLWWSRVRRDVRELKNAMHVDQEEVAKETRLTRRKTTLDPDMVAEYDIAVVLTGINDLKDAFLPFMVQTKNATNANAESQPGSLKEALMRIVDALQTKMKLDLEVKDEATVATSPTGQQEQPPVLQQRQQQQHLLRGPLVVFPAIPSSPLPMTHYPPLSWFLVPLIRMMDNNKRLLAESFPGLVLYVDPPSPEDFRDIESGKGELHANRRAEQVLLQITNVTQRAQEKVKELMREHYEHRSHSAAEESEDDDRKDDTPLVYGQGCRDHQLVETKLTPGSTLIAEDRIHPNDAGYDFWGRHIAAAIVQEWKN